jgi:lipoate-protein ligase A
MLHQVKDLSPEQRQAVESLLGRPVAMDESVIVKSVRSSATSPPQLSQQEREEALEKLRQYFAKVDAQRKPINEADEDEIINEALRSTRPNYRPIH